MKKFVVESTSAICQAYNLNISVNSNKLLKHSNIKNNNNNVSHSLKLKVKPIEQINKVSLSQLDKELNKIIENLKKKELELNKK
jgi:hypothetical protein